MKDGGDGAGKKAPVAGSTGFPSPLRAHNKDNVFNMFAMVAGMVSGLALAMGTPAMAQSKTPTLEEISQKLKGLEVYQKKIEAQLKAQHQKLVEEWEARKKELAEAEALAKKNEDSIGKRLLYEGTIPGFIYFPGTKTQFRFGGYARIDAIHNLVLFF